MAGVSGLGIILPIVSLTAALYGGISTGVLFYQKNMLAKNAIAESDSENNETILKFLRDNFDDIDSKLLKDIADRLDATTVAQIDKDESTGEKLIHLNYSMLNKMFVDTKGNIKNEALLRTFISHELRHIDNPKMPEFLVGLGDTIDFISSFAQTFLRNFVIARAPAKKADVKVSENEVDTNIDNAYYDFMDRVSQGKFVFDRNSEQTQTQIKLSNQLAESEFSQLGMGKGKQAAIAIAVAKLWTHQVLDKNENFGIILTTKTDILAGRDAEYLVEFLNSEEMQKAFSKNGVTTPKVGVFEKNKYFVYSADGTRTEVTDFAELQEEADILFGVPENEGFTFMEGSFSDKQWFGIKDEADDALVSSLMTPLIKTGNTPKRTARASIEMAKAADKAAKALISKYADSKDSKKFRANSYFDYSGGSVILTSKAIRGEYYSEVEKALEELGIRVVDGTIPDNLQNVISRETFDFEWEKAVQNALQANINRDANEGARTIINSEGKTEIIDENTGMIKHGQKESFLDVAIAIANGLEAEAQKIIEDQISYLSVLRGLYGENFERLAATSGSFILNKTFVESVYNKTINDLDNDGGEAKINAFNLGTKVFETIEQKRDYIVDVVTKIKEDRKEISPMIRVNSIEQGRELIQQLTKRGTKFKTIKDDREREYILSSYAKGNLPSFVDSNFVLFVDANLKEMLGDDLKGFVQAFFDRNAIIVTTNVIATGESFRGTIFGIDSGFSSPITRKQFSGRPARSGDAGFYLRTISIEDLENLHNDKVENIKNLLTESAMDYEKGSFANIKTTADTDLEIGAKYEPYRSLIEVFLNGQDNLGKNISAKDIARLDKIEEIVEADKTSGAVSQATDDKISFFRQQIQEVIDSFKGDQWQKEFFGKILTDEDFKRIGFENKLAQTKKEIKAIKNKIKEIKKSIAKSSEDKDQTQELVRTLALLEKGLESNTELLAKLKGKEKDIDDSFVKIGKDIVEAIRKEKVKQAEKQKIEFINNMAEVENNENYFSSKKWVNFVLEKANINTRNISARRYYAAERKLINEIQSSKLKALNYEGLRDGSYTIYRISKFFKAIPHKLLSVILSIVDIVAPLLPVFGTVAIVTMATGILVTGAASSIALLPLAGAVTLILGLYAAKKFFIDKLNAYQVSQSYDTSIEKYKNSYSWANAAKATKGVLNKATSSIATMSLFSSVAFLVIGLFAANPATLIAAAAFFAMIGLASTAVSVGLNFKNLKIISSQNTINDKSHIYAGFFSGTVATFAIGLIIKFALAGTFATALPAVIVGGVIAALAFGFIQYSDRQNYISAKINYYAKTLYQKARLFHRVARYLQKRHYDSLRLSLGPQLRDMAYIFALQNFLHPNPQIFLQFLINLVC